MKRTKLSAEDQHFFKNIYNISFANPFSSLREKLDSRVAEIFPASSLAKSKKICQKKVSEKIKNLKQQNLANINAYHGQDREIITIVFLFDWFHRFRDNFDQVIKGQIIAGDTSICVPFAEEARQILYKRGFNSRDVSHYLALAYQLRRAFYFISKALVGASPSMKKLKKHLWYNVFTYNLDLYNKSLWNKMEDFSTLILGETGTGKGTAAKAIGRSGYIPFDNKKQCFTQSFTQIFSSLNLSQYPETLLESELFGHTKGAFTGAVDNHQGMFDRCSPHGSILLDEIGEIPNHVQIKLLKILQERTFSPVGTHSTSRFNGRVIAATNRPRQDIIDGKVFRDDFYYRLCSDIIEVPPLRVRIREKNSELDELLDFTIERMTGTCSEALNMKVKKIIDHKLGNDYLWPGNVRELEQCVRNVLLRRDYKGVQKNSNQIISLEQRIINGVSDRTIRISDLLSGYCKLLYDKVGSYAKVAQMTGLDRRTIKKYIMSCDYGSALCDNVSETLTH